MQDSKWFCAECDRWVSTKRKYHTHDKNVDGNSGFCACGESIATIHNVDGSGYSRLRREGLLVCLACFNKSPGK